MPSQRPFRLAGAFYFLFFGAAGILLPYINLYFSKIGLTGSEIGFLGALLPLLMLSAGPLWGALGDRFHVHRWLLPLATIGAIAPTLLILLSGTRQLAPLALLLCASAFFNAPVTGLIDSSVLDMIHGTGRSYGGLRLWGSIGFMLITWIIGYVIKWWGLAWIFYSYGLVLLAAGLVALGLPARAARGLASYRAGVASLLRQRSLLLFLAATFVIGATLQASFSFYPLYLVSLGANPAWLGLAGAVAAATEIPVLLVSGRLFRRIGVRRAVLAGFTLFVVRWAMLALVTSPLLALASNLLHGVTYGLYLAGTVAYVEAHTPPGLRATAQGVLAASGMGFGAAVGALGGGWLYDAIGGRGMFGVAALLAVGAILLVALASSRPVAQAPAGGQP